MSQKDRILKYLKSGKRITPAIAYEKFGCLRLSERIREIHDELQNKWQNNVRTRASSGIQKDWKQINKRTRVMEYWL